MAKQMPLSNITAVVSLGIASLIGTALLFYLTLPRDTFADQFGEICTSRHVATEQSEPPR